MRKKLLSIVVMVTLAATMISGCGAKETDTGTNKESTTASKGSEVGGGQSAKGETLTIWMPPFGTDDIPDKEFWTEQLKPLIDETGVKINMEIVPWGEYETKYLTGITSGEGPDIGYMYNEMLADFIDMGAIEPLDGYFTQEEKDNYLYLDKGIINEKLYTLPIIVGNARVLFCNMDILNAAGVDKVPTTWEEYIQTAQAIKEKVPDKDPILMQWADPAIGALNEIFYPYLWQNGSDIFDSNGKLTVNTPEALEVAQFLYDLKFKYEVLPEKATSLKGEDCKNAFIAGDVGMIVLDSRSATEITDAGVNWDFVPSLKKKQQGTFIAADALVLLSDSKNKELAAKAMKLMTSGPVMSTFHKTLYSQPPITKDEQYADNEKFKDMYQNQTDIFHTLPVAAGSFKVYDTLYKNLQLMMQDQMTPKEALEQTEAYAKSVLEQ